MKRSILIVLFAFGLIFSQSPLTLADFRALEHGTIGMARAGNDCSGNWQHFGSDPSGGVCMALARAWKRGRAWTRGHPIIPSQSHLFYDFGEL